LFDSHALPSEAIRNSQFAIRNPQLAMEQGEGANPQSAIESRLDGVSPYHSQRTIQWNGGAGAEATSCGNPVFETGPRREKRGLTGKMALLQGKSYDLFTL
jgi:hypothetical protein